MESLGSELRGKVVLIAGGQSKGADFDGLLDGIDDSIRRAVLFGEDAEQIRRALQRVVESSCFDSLDEAVDAAIASAQFGDVILFSPACASFDMFDNFEHRGREFKRAVSSWVEFDG